MLNGTNSKNITGEHSSYYEEFKFASQVIENILLALAITGNVLLLIAHRKDPLKVFQTPMAQFILNIAFVDLIAATLMVLSIILHIDDKNSLSARVIFLPVALSFPSFFSLSLERFCSVAYPLWHRANVTIRLSRLWLLGMWILHISYEVLCVLIDEATDSQFTSGCINVSYVFFFFISTQGLYLATCVSLKTQTKRIMVRQDSASNQSSVTRAVQARLLNEKHFLITIATVCTILALTVLPAITFYKLLFFICPELIDDSYYTARIIVLLLRLNFTVNPAIYLWRLKSYRKTFKVLYCKC